MSKPCMCCDTQYFTVGLSILYYSSTVRRYMKRVEVRLRVRDFLREKGGGEGGGWFLLKLSHFSLGSNRIAE